MISILANRDSDILAASDAIVGAPQKIDAAIQVLTVMDQVFMGLGAILAVVWLYRLFRTGWRDPIGDAPVRASGLREDAVALAAFAYLIAAVAFGAVSQSLSGGDHEAMGEILAASGSQIAGLAVCLSIASKKFSGGSKRFLLGTGVMRFRALAGTTSGGLLLALAACPIVLVGTIELTRLVAPDFELPVHPTITVLHERELSYRLQILLWVGAAVVAPIAEEVFFRGILQTVVLNILGHRWSAIMVASAVFALIHFPQPHAIPALFILAVIMGYAYERSGSLISPIAIHALFNLKTLIWDAVGSGM